MSDPSIVERDADPAEVFAALADPTRVAILRALWEAEDKEATFSELREAVDVDDSGRFNYHLGKLRDQFLVKDGDVYRFRLAGRRIVGALLSGAFTQTGAADPVALDAACPVCGGATALHYENEEVRIVCDEHDHVSLSFSVPPGVFADYAREEIPAVADKYAKSSIQRSRNGICINCEGRVDTRVRPAEASLDIDEDDPLYGLVVAVYGCRRCGETITIDLRNALIDHPAVAGFYYEHGVDVREQFIWERLEFDADRIRVLEESPLEVEVVFEVGDDALVLTVDDGLCVLDVGEN